MDLRDFVETDDLGSLGPFALRAARGPRGDALLLLAEGADGAVSQISAAHGAVTSEQVPRALASGPGWVALDASPLCTLEGLLGRAPASSVPYSEGIVLSETLALALSHAHAAGFVLGAVSASSVIVTQDGRLVVVGFGGGGPLAADGGFSHPLVAAGGAPTPATDVYACLMLVRSLVRLVKGLPAQLASVLVGEGDGRFVTGLLAALTGGEGVDGARALAALRAFWRTLGVTPDRAALAARLTALAASRRASRLTLGPGAAWFSVDDGPRVSLEQKRAQRAILSALVSAREGSGRLSVDALVAAGWPGESLRGTSGRDRLYTAVATLRSAGLRDVIERDSQGYGVASEIEIVAAR